MLYLKILWIKIKENYKGFRWTKLNSYRWLVHPFNEIEEDVILFYLSSQGLFACEASKRFEFRLHHPAPSSQSQKIKDKFLLRGMFTNPVKESGQSNLHLNVRVYRSSRPHCVTIKYPDETIRVRWAFVYFLKYSFSNTKQIDGYLGVEYETPIFNIYNHTSVVSNYYKDLKSMISTAAIVAKVASQSKRNKKEVH